MEGGTKSASRDVAKGSGGPNTSAKSINRKKEVTLGGPAAFKDNGWELSDELKENLDRLIVVLKSKKKKIMVRGHASPRPYPKNLDFNYPQMPLENRWDLSFARAVEVSEYMVKVGGIDRERVVVSAVGDTEPHTIFQDSGSSESQDPESTENQLNGINRRVDVFLIDSYIKAKQTEE